MCSGGVRDLRLCTWWSGPPELGCKVTPAIHGSGFLVALGHTSGLRLGVTLAPHVTRNLGTSTKWLVGGHPRGVGSPAFSGAVSGGGGLREDGHGWGLQPWASRLREPARLLRP